MQNGSALNIKERQLADRLFHRLIERTRQLDRPLQHNGGGSGEKMELRERIDDGQAHIAARLFGGRFAADGTVEQQKQILCRLDAARIRQLGDRDGLAVAHNCRQHADDLLVGDAVFQIAAVVAAHDVAAVTDSDDAVKDILSALAFVERDIKPPEGLLHRLNDQKVTRLNQRKHAVALVGIDELALSGDDVLKGRFSHRLRRWISADGWYLRRRRG